MINRLLQVAVCAALLPVGDAVAQARPPFGSSFSPGEASDAVRQGQHIPLRQVIRQIEAREGGKLLDAQLVSRGPGQSAVYEVQWLSAVGQRIDFVIDAETGAILARRG
jgi:hypothetical protein